MSSQAAGAWKKVRYGSPTVHSEDQPLASRQVGARCKNLVAYLDYPGRGYRDNNRPWAQPVFLLMPLVNVPKSPKETGRNLDLTE